MALNATFTADFTQFDRAVANAQQTLRPFEQRITGVARDLQRMTSSFDGTRLIREATLAAAAVDKIGGVTKLTEGEQRRLNSTLQETLSKYNALGKDAPEELRKIAAETEKAVKAADDLRAKNQQTGDSMVSLGGMARSVGGMLAGAFTIGAVTSLATDVINLGGEISDTADRLKISTDAVQEFSYGLGKTGSSIDALAGAMEKMSKRLTEGGNGTISAVKTLGLSLDDLRKSRTEDAFTAIADAIKGVPEPMRQTQLAMELFGESGAEMLPAIRAGMSDLRQEAHDLAQVMSKDAVEGLDALGDAWGVVVGATKTAVGELLSDVAKVTKEIKDMQASVAVRNVDGSQARTPFSQRFEIGDRQFEAAKKEAERIQKVLDGIKVPSLFAGGASGFKADTPSFEEQERAAKAQMAQVEAALEYAKAVKTVADAWRAADLTRQLKAQEDAFRSLTAEQRKNPLIVKSIVEEYGKLRQHVGPGALPRDLESFYRAHLPLIGGVRQLIDVTGRYATATLPDLSRRTQEATNMLRGLTADGIIPTSRAFGDLFDKMRVPVPESLGNVAQQVTETQEKTVDLTASFDDLSRAFAQLAQARPLDGWIQDMAEFIGLMNVAAQAGRQLGQGIEAFRSASNTGEYVAAGLQTAAGGASAASALDQATDVQGRGNRALRGAATGASIGANPALMAMTGGLSVLAGAAIGALIGAFRNPGFEDVMKRVAKDFGVNISEELARSIDKQKKAFGNDRGAAEIANLDKIVAEGGGVKDANFKQLSDRLRDAFSMVETGKFTVEQARQVLEKNFSTFAAHVEKSKSLASKSFTELFELNKRFGTDSEQMRAFVEGQTRVLGGGVAALAGPLMEEYGGLGDAIDKARKEVDRLNAGGRAGTEEFANAVQHLNTLQGKQKEGAAAAGKEFERLGIIALGSFNAALAAGGDLLEAVRGMGPGLDALLRIQQDLGLTSANPALGELMNFRDLVNNNQTLVASAGALGQTLRAVTSIGGLTTDMLSAMEGQGVETFERLTRAGFSENQALSTMRDFLINVKEAHERLGTPIDANTQRLIDQAEQAGLLKDDGNDMTAALKQGFTNVTDAIMKVVEALGGNLPRAAEDAKRAIERIPTRVPVEVELAYRDPGMFEGGRIVRPRAESEPESEGTSRPQTDRPSFAAGGWGNFGSGTLAMLHGKETILTEPQLRGLAGVVQQQNARVAASEPSISVHIGEVNVAGNADAHTADDIGEAIARKLMQGGRLKSLWNEAVR